MKEIFLFLLNALNSSNQTERVIAQNTLDIAKDVSKTCEQTDHALRTAIEEHVEEQFKANPKHWSRLQEIIKQVRTMHNTLTAKINQNIANN